VDANQKEAAFMLTVPMTARHLNEVTDGQPLKDIPWDRPPGARTADTGGNLGTRMSEVKTNVGSGPRKPKKWSYRLEAGGWRAREGSWFVSYGATGAKQGRDEETYFHHDIHVRTKLSPRGAQGLLGHCLNARSLLLAAPFMPGTSGFLGTLFLAAGMALAWRMNPRVLVAGPFPQASWPQRIDPMNIEFDLLVCPCKPTGLIISGWRVQKSINRKDH